MKHVISYVLALGVAASVIADTGRLGDEAYAVLKASYGYDAGYPLDVRRVGSVQQGGVTYERFAFRSFHDGRVPGILAVPPEGEGPFPVVLLLHGLTGTKENWLESDFTHGGEVSSALLERGYAVVALDAQYHGQRAAYNDFVNPGEMVFERGWGMRYANLIAQTVVDYRRVIDYLASREDIDPERVGVLGYSMGGHMSFILGAVEPRIRAVVACVVPSMAGSPIRAAQFARDLGSGPLLLLMARKDRFYTAEEAQALFDAVPGNSKEIRLFDSGHSLPAEYVTEAAEWLSTHL
jgi:dienelactone hydrolase